MPLRVNLNDPQLDVFSLAHHLLGMGDALITELGNVHQAFHTWLELRERAELRQLGDLGRHRIADVVLLLDPRPRIFFDLLQAEADFLVLAVDGDDAYVDLLTDSEHLAWMLDLAPR